MILAGFLFAIGGVAYTNSVSSLSTVLLTIKQSSSELIKINKLNFAKEKKEIFDNVVEVDKNYLNITKPQLELIKYLFRVFSNINFSYSLVVGIF